MEIGHIEVAIHYSLLFKRSYYPFNNGDLLKEFLVELKQRSYSHFPAALADSATKIVLLPTGHSLVGST